MRWDLRRHEARPLAPQPVPVCGNGECEAERGESFGNCASDCGSLEFRADYLERLLETEFEVDEGVFKIFEVADCEDLERCFFNNPTSPYGSFQVPLGPGEPEPDPDNRGMSPPGLSTVYRLREDEALLWIGTLPPESPYFSFTAYIFSRFDPDAAGPPPYDDRAIVYSSLGDSQNHLTMSTSAGQGESPFGKESILIVTADRTTDRVVRSLLDGAGFSESIANTLVIPRFEADGVTPLARMGYENEADLFNVLARIANPDAIDPDSEIHAWLREPGSTVLRIRPRRAQRSDPIPFPVPRVPGSDGAEDGASLRRLVRRIQDAHGVTARETVLAVVSPVADGDHCLNAMVCCNADCRDTPYMTFAFTLGRDDAMIVAGYNHENSNKACYVNITSTRFHDGTAYYSIVMRDLIGSAGVYLPYDPDAENLWQLMFARNCGDEPFCFEITEDQLAVGELGVILVRAYLDPATGTKAKMIPKMESELAYPRAIYLRGGRASDR